MHDGHSLQPSAAFRSMLRTTTEMGDVGQMPLSASRPRNRASRAPHFPAGHGNHAGVSRQADLSARARFRTPSDSSAWDDGLYRRRVSPADNVESRASGLVSARGSLHARRSVRTQQSYSSLRGRGGRPVVVTRPRSPYALASRCVRGSFMTTSPVHSEAAAVEYTELYPVVRHHSVRTSPPTSAHTRRRHDAVHRPENPGPVRSPVTLLPSAVWRHHSQRILPPRPLSPILAPDLSALDDAAVVRSARTATTHEQSRTPSPLYYDYTEAFEDTHHHATTQSSASVSHLHPCKSFDDKRRYDSSSGTDNFVDARQTFTGSSSPSEDLETPQEARHASSSSSGQCNERPVAARLVRPRQVPINILDRTEPCHVLPPFHRGSLRRRAAPVAWTVSLRGAAPNLRRAASSSAVQKQRCRQAEAFRAVTNRSEPALHPRPTAAQGYLVRQMRTANEPAVAI